MKALVIKADDTSALIDIEQNVKVLQDAVGGYIEAVISTDDWVMYANEDGLRLNLPLNRKASSLVLAICEVGGRPVPLGAGQLVGDVVITGYDDEGDNAPIPESWVQQFKDLGLWAEEGA